MKYRVNVVTTVDVDALTREDAEWSALEWVKRGSAWGFQVSDVEEVLDETLQGKLFDEEA